MPRKEGARYRLKRFFREHVGEVVTKEQLQEVAQIQQWARRVREIRTEEGWAIRTNNDDASLKPGEYMLTEPPPETENYVVSRRISNRLRAQVLERNGYTCQMCGAGAGDPDPQQPGRQIRLHVGHVVDRIHGGKDELTNLKAMCSTCNQGARNLVQEPPSWVWLLSQLRRASVEDQTKALEWLNSKFASK